MFFIVSISLETVVSKTLVYILVVRISECPSIFAMVSIETLLARAKQAKLCRAIWKERSNMSNGNEKKAQRNLLVIKHFSIFFHIKEKQKSEAY